MVEVGGRALDDRLTFEQAWDEHSLRDDPRFDDVRL
jgi:hypothetical protein